MNKWWSRRLARGPGWLAISLQPGELHFAHGVGGLPGRCTITRCGTHALAEAPQELERVTKQLDLRRYPCLTLLPADDYQLLLVDAPNVPPAEMKAAVRWRVKDMLDYPLDQATIDVLDIPPDPAGGARAQSTHSMYAVAARNEIVRARMDRLEAGRLALRVIDIPETAQRNVAALFEIADRGVAFLYCGKSQSLLTVNYRGELYLARRIDVGVDDLLATAAAGREDPRGRVLLELQRSFDHFERQFPFVGVAKLVIGPEPTDTGLAAFLAQNFDFPVEQAELESVLQFGPDATLAGDDAWRLFHVLGASLRAERA
jgi:MSHA biogenesis protein MshI